MTTPELPPVKIAFIIDGVVADVLHTDDRLAAIFLSEPTIVDVSEWLVNNPEKTLTGATYDGTTFTADDAPVYPGVVDEHLAELPAE
jgi:hypothetical protein